MPVVDASIAVDWVAPRTPSDSSAMHVLRTLASQRAELIAPRILLEEVATARLTYDMLYVAVAKRMRTTLITADDRLRSRLAALPWVIGPEQV